MDASEVVPVEVVSGLSPTDRVIARATGPVEEGTPVTAEVFEEMCRSYDIGVAEFLDLSYVKPNILGNSRMLLVL